MKKLLITLLAVLFMAGSAFAAVTHTDGDKYGDQYTVEDTNGNWTFAGNVTMQGTKIGDKTSITTISTTADTVGTVTVAKSGGLFVLAPTSGAVPGGVGYTVTLPATANTITGLTYTFSCATGSTLSVQTPSATDSIIMYLGTGTNIMRVTSPAASGSSITLVGQSGTTGVTPGKWYVASITGTWVAATT